LLRKLRLKIAIVQRCTNESPVQLLLMPGKLLSSHLSLLSSAHRSSTAFSAMRTKLAAIFGWLLWTLGPNCQAVAHSRFCAGAEYGVRTFWCQRCPT